MIVNRDRIDHLIASRGVERTMTVEQWANFVNLVVNELGNNVCYSFSLYPHSAPPQKGFLAGFPGRITADLEYLHTLDLVVIDERSRRRLTDFLAVVNALGKALSSMTPTWDPMSRLESAFSGSAPKTKDCTIG